MILVEVLNGDIEQAIRFLRKRFGGSGLKRDLDRHAYFIGPSERKRLKHKEAVKRLRKLDKKREYFKEMATRRKRWELRQEQFFSLQEKTVRSDSAPSLAGGNDGEGTISWRSAVNQPDNTNPFSRNP